MNIYKFRVIIDTEEDVFRDIEIQTDANFLALHDSIKAAFNFEGLELSSFYMSNENWDKGQEIPQMDMGIKDEEGQEINMATTLLSSFVKAPDEKIVFVYDFMRMWCFYVELVEIRKAAPSTLYPKVSMIYGEAPEEESKELDLFGDVAMPGSTGDSSDEADSIWEDDLDEMNEDKFTSLDDLDEYI